MESDGGEWVKVPTISRSPVSVRVQPVSDTVVSLRVDETEYRIRAAGAHTLPFGDAEFDALVIERRVDTRP